MEKYLEFRQKRKSIPYHMTFSEREYIQYEIQTTKLVLEYLDYIVESGEEDLCKLACKVERNIGSKDHTLKCLSAKLLKLLKI